MDKAYPLSLPMIVRSLDVKRTHFVLVKRVKNYLVLKYHILVSLVHLCILLIEIDQNIAFSVNLLVRHISAPTQRHWNGIKHILCYLQGTTDMGPFYAKESKKQLFGYADAGPFKPT